MYDSMKEDDIPQHLMGIVMHEAHWRLNPGVHKEHPAAVLKSHGMVVYIILPLIEPRAGVNHKYSIHGVIVEKMAKILQCVWCYFFVCTDVGIFDGMVCTSRTLVNAHHRSSEMHRR